MSEFTISQGDYITSVDLASPASGDCSGLMLMRRSTLEVVDVFFYRGDLKRCRRAPWWAKMAMRAVLKGVRDEPV